MSARARDSQSLKTRPELNTVAPCRRLVRMAQRARAAAARNRSLLGAASLSAPTSTNSVSLPRFGKLSLKSAWSENIWAGGCENETVDRRTSLSSPS
jgi:hypothetical protein